MKPPIIPSLERGETHQITPWKLAQRGRRENEQNPGLRPSKTEIRPKTAKRIPKLGVKKRQINSPCKKHLDLTQDQSRRQITIPRYLHAKKSVTNSNPKRNSSLDVLHTTSTICQNQAGHLKVRKLQLWQQGETEQI